MWNNDFDSSEPIMCSLVAYMQIAFSFSKQLLWYYWRVYGTTRWTLYSWEETRVTEQLRTVYILPCSRVTRTHVATVENDFFYKDSMTRGFIHLYITYKSDQYVLKWWCHLLTKSQRLGEMTLLTSHNYRMHYNLLVVLFHALFGYEVHSVPGNTLSTNAKTNERSQNVRRPGIEPGSTAWKATMLTFTPPTLGVFFKV